MRNDDGSERQFKLGAGQLVIGRNARCDVRVAMPDVAPKHCTLELRSGNVHLSAHDGTTLVNGQPHAGSPLRDRDRLMVGPVQFELRVGGAGDHDALQLDPLPGS